MFGFIELAPLAIAGVDLVWVIVGVFCIVLSFAGWVIFRVLDDLFGGISILGFRPFHLVFGLLEGVMKKFNGWADGQVVHFGKFLWALVMFVWRPLFMLSEVLFGLAANIFSNAQDAQHGTSAETNRATGAENGLQAQINQNAAANSQAFSYLDQAVNTLNQSTIPTVVAELNLLDSRLTALQGQAGGVSAAQLAQLQNQLEQELTNNVSNLNAGIQHAEDLAVQGDNNLSAQLQNQVANGVSTAESFATGAIAGAAPGIVAQAVAAMQPPLNAITTDLAECLDPLCDTVTPNASQLGDLGKLLKALEALFGAAALTGLLVAAVEDPKRAADDLVSVAGWMSTLGLDMVDAVGSAAGVQL